MTTHACMCQCHQYMLCGVVLYVQLRQYQYYSVGLLSNYDMFYDHQKSIIGPNRRKQQDKTKLDKKLLKGLF
jgi:hypothetical protein